MSSLYLAEDEPAPVRRNPKLTPEQRRRAQEAAHDQGGEEETAGECQYF